MIMPQNDPSKSGFGRFLSDASDAVRNTEPTTPTPIPASKNTAPSSTQMQVGVLLSELLAGISFIGVLVVTVVSVVRKLKR
jgi:hypothetical protein